MNNAVHLIIVSTDDYEALYINERFASSEHRLDLSQVLRLLMGYRIETFKDYYIDPDVLEEKYNCDFPFFFEDFDLEDLTT